MLTLFRTDAGQVVHSTTEAEARAFWETTQALCAFSGAKMMLGPLSNGECRVEAKPFCALVEWIFNHPEELFYPWAREAAGFYEAIKRERYTWVWDQALLPLSWEHVTRNPAFQATQVSEKIIGKVTR